ncbi:MAG: hypothetical protein HOM21_08380 [Halobacteriovoraceae bacterium]|nr:hypothetical protein [Halobacteriovoraceae bacterium]
MKYDPRGQAIWFSGGDQSVYITILENKITSFEIILDRMILEGKMEGLLKFGLIQASKISGTKHKGSRVVHYTTKIPSRLIEKARQVVSGLEGLEPEIKSSIDKFLQHFMKSSSAISRENNPMIFQEILKSYDPNWRDYAGNIDYELETVKRISKGKANKYLYLALVLALLLIGGGLKLYFSSIKNMTTDFKSGLKLVSKSLKKGPLLEEGLSQDLLEKLETFWKFNGITYIKNQNCDPFRTDLNDSFTLISQKSLSWIQLDKLCSDQSLKGSICQNWQKAKKFNSKENPIKITDPKFKGFWAYQDIQYVISQLGHERFQDGNYSNKFFSNPLLGSFKKKLKKQNMDQVKEEASKLCLSFLEYQLYQNVKDENKNKMYEIYNQSVRLEKSDDKEEFIQNLTGSCQKYINQLNKFNKKTLAQGIPNCQKLMGVPENIIKSELCNGSYPLACLTIKH